MLLVSFFTACSSIINGTGTGAIIVSMISIDVGDDGVLLTVVLLLVRLLFKIGCIDDDDDDDAGVNDVDMSGGGLIVDDISGAGVGGVDGVVVDLVV